MLLLFENYSIIIPEATPSVERARAVLARLILYNRQIPLSMEYRRDLSAILTTYIIMLQLK